jgi:hypothetical protein
MDWTTVTLEDGRQRHNAQNATRRLVVYDWLGGRCGWRVYDEIGDETLAMGKSASADEAKAAAEQAAGR